MEAQKIIDESQTEERKEEFLELFFPDVSLQKKTDTNITKCLRELR